MEGYFRMAQKKVKYSDFLPEIEVPRERVPPDCSRCPSLACWPLKGEDALKLAPPQCATKNYPDIVEKAKEIYMNDPEEKKLQIAGSILEGLSSQTPPGGREINMKYTRLEELAMFCHIMGYKKVGIAHCIGMIGEARATSDYLRQRGIKTYQLCCKTGAIEKTEIGIAEEDKVRPMTFETICNNIAQALIFNEIGTDLNLIVGLCLGHDIAFTRHSKAPVTTLVVKDRRTGHAPAVPMYEGYSPYNFYYGRIGNKPTSESGGR
jgi:uncharacterized metal-binding protein